MSVPGGGQPATPPPPPATGGLFGSGVLNETDPTNWPGRYSGRLTIAGYPYQVVGNIEYTARGPDICLRVYNTPPDRRAMDAPE